MPNRIHDSTQKSAARIAGILLLLMAVFAGFANGFVLQGLVVPGDGAATADHIAANEMLFRSGFFSFILVLILDVLVAWTLYILLEPVNSLLSMLAAWLRLIYTAIFAAALFPLLNVIELINNESDLFNNQILHMIQSFKSGWMIGLVFFGLHLFMIGYIIVKSACMPRIIGILLILASAAYLIDSFAQFLLPNYAEYEAVFLVIVAIPAIIGELSLAFWLLFKVPKVRESNPVKVNENIKL